MTNETPAGTEALFTGAENARRHGELDRAAEHYRSLLAQMPGHARGLNGLGLTLHEQGKPEDAIKFYVQSLRALPDQADVLLNFGLSLKKLDRPDLAIQAFRESVRCAPENVESLKALGQTLQTKGQMEEAVAAYRQALTIAPDHAEILALLVYLLRQNCDWNWLAELEKRLLCLVREGAPGVPPFIILTLDSAPADQLAAGRAWSRKYERPTSARPAEVTGGARPKDRLRIGYLSADYHEHATAYLVAELFERHDRTRFEIFAYSSGPDDPGPMRQRLQKGVDRFVRVGGISDQEAAAKIRADEIDILVDLKGYTKGTRAGILALRPAPVQASFLGYPGTSGADFIDWLIADPIIIPPEHRAYYSETLALLPHCYQPNDSKRPIADPSPSRADHGLPDDGFVFCCFNSSYKITPTYFDIWMRLLRNVPGSVLWLFASNPWAELNLRSHAVDAGIGAHRLVFARDLPLAKHLARYRRADLFLDTLPYTGHTTVSDALWTGLPAVTAAGNTFAGLVAASLLTAIGLPELVAPSPADYEAMALRLALTPGQLADVRARLAQNRLTTPLFNVERYTRDLEALYLKMV